MAFGEFNQVKFGGCEDLQIFGKPIQVDKRRDNDGQRLDRAIRLPHGISCMLDQSIEPKQFGQSMAILW
jgi:hypothetical protein